jgi:group I intron endonuclease
MSTGIIYKITNTITKKCYIGQTTTTVKKRWSQHTYNTRGKKSKCVLLENTIQKHGVENFTIEPVFMGDVKELDTQEIKFISEYKSTNIKFGYNICAGGNGSVGRPVDDEHRNKISKANRKSQLDTINIQERKVNGILTGYVVSKNMNNVRYTKNFANIKNSTEDNLKLAKEWLKNLDDGKLDDVNRYNRTIKLPKNIAYNYNNKKVKIGYNVKIERGGVRYCKSFTLKDNTMEEKLKQAIIYKEQILNSLRKNEEEKSLKGEQDNPQPSA